MTNHEYDRPWQVMPAKIIKLALEFAEKDDDFDHQVAYLLLDIGVETALKAYLINRGHNVEKINFPQLLQQVKEELTKTNPDLLPQIDDIGYFHGIRNKLYHQGDGVIPTEDNLKRYSELAKRIVEEIIEVNLETEEKKDVVPVRGTKHEIEDLIDHIEIMIKDFQKSCGIVTEKTHPAYATREYEMKLRYIISTWPDSEELEPEDRIDNRKKRLEKFNELMEKKQTSYEVVDYLMGDINRIYVLVALKRISENFQEDLHYYLELEKRRPRLLSDWKSGLQSGRSTPEQVYEEFNGINSWIGTHKKKVDEWIDSHMENIEREYHPSTHFDMEHLFDDFLS